MLKCQLQPLADVEYGVAFTDEQWDRLETVFPDGVGDYSRDGVGQVPLLGTWLSFGPDGTAPSG